MTAGGNEKPAGAGGSEEEKESGSDTTIRVVYPEANVNLSPERIAQLEAEVYGRPVSALTDTELYLSGRKEILGKIRIPKVWTTAELLETDFPPIQYVIPDILPSGLSILAGAPKIGKSWFALQLAAALSVGGYVLGSVRVEKRETAYFALEDGPRRMRSRLDRIGALPDRETLRIIHGLPRKTDPLDFLDAWMASYPRTKVIIIDTLARLFPAGFDTNAYSDSYELIAALKTFADRFDIALIVVHHTRKNPGEGDWTQGINGSVGFSGAADSLVMLRRGRGEAGAVLSVTGRDIPERELALNFDPTVGSWTLLGDAAEYSQTNERREILEVLQGAGELKTGEIAKELGKELSAVSHILRRMHADGLVENPSYGKWARKERQSCQTVKPREDIPSIFQEEEGDIDTLTGLTPISGGEGLLF
jgi:DNA-binding transcriptional ArsR family regulator